MKYNNIKRNSLDYILTDILPVELTELYTHKFFYEFLMKNINLLDDAIKKIIKEKNKADSETILFHNSNFWTSIPLKYSVLKDVNSTRELNLLQPNSVLEIFLFISAYQKEILNLLEKRSVFSIRYHHKNNDLHYKRKSGAITQYFYKAYNVMESERIQQTGLYFNIGPYNSMVAFTNSDLWFTLIRKYKYFVKTDIKNCFGSIYTHTYKWLIGKDVNDTKDFRNVNLLISIDRILQNINSRTSNGIVVGPEFSRMIAEILLQGIDNTVMNILVLKGYKKGYHYDIYRYVDDIFIFAESESLIDYIYEVYSKTMKKYLLDLNEGKTTKSSLPFSSDPWLKDSNFYVTQVSNILFYSKDELEKNFEKEKKEKNEAFQNDNIDPEITLNLIKSFRIRDKHNLMQKFNELMCLYPQNAKTIVSYFFGMLLNKMESKVQYDLELSKRKELNKADYYILKVLKNVSSLYDYLDYIMYVYSYFPSYSNTQKLLSIINFINDEINFEENKQIIEKIIIKYAYIFDNARINDVINLILFCASCSIEIPYIYEVSLLERIREEDNPILWATYFIYSKYDNDYSDSILTEIEKIIKYKVEAIIKKDNILTYKEFWWLLIFNKCPLICKDTQKLFDEIIINNFNINLSKESNSADICKYLLKDYLLNNKKQFFEWEIEKSSLLKKISYKTYERSIFRNYNTDFNYQEY